MRTVIQRVSSVQAIEAQTKNALASIDRGLLIFVAFETQDSPISMDKMTQKIRSLRIFPDEDGKMNLSGPEVKAQYLLVSQFTLYADCRYGNRPSFTQAAPKPRAKEYYGHFVETFCRVMGAENVKSTPFGSELSIQLTNEGPVTLWLDSTEVL